MKILIALFWIVATGAAEAQQARYFAEVIDGVVKRVIVIDPAELKKGHWGDPKNWIETHSDGGARKNYASPGDTFDATRDAFVSRKPYPSWVINDGTARWVAPVPMPVDGKEYEWIEADRNWRERKARSR